MLQRIVTTLIIALATIGASAQTLEVRAGLNLKNILHDLISHHNDLGYDKLWDAYATTDWHPATAQYPNGYLWDMYSNVINTNFQTKGSNNSTIEGEVYNREHTVPQSWFDEARPMMNDLFHVYPVDGKINSLRNDYPYGDVQTISSSSRDDYSKYGIPTSECGAPVNVFEPADEYKGDLARTYFYMVVCYQEQINSWKGPVFGQKDKYSDYKGYPGMVEWELHTLLRWSQEDPVSQKERDRNEAVYKLQGNRNPFIDCPGLERFIWSEYIN